MSVYAASIYLLVLYWIGNKYLLRLKSSYLFIFLTIVTLTIILGCRDAFSVGVDMLQYFSHYQTTRFLSIQEIVKIHGLNSPLYYLLCAIFSKLNIDYQIFTYCLACFCVSSTGYFTYKYCENALIGFFAYLGMGVFTFQFSGLRQSIAMSLLLFCFHFYWEKKYTKCLVLFLAAVLFHITAIVFLPFLILSQLKLSKIIFTCYISGLIIVFTLRNQIGHIVTMLFADEYIGVYKSSATIGGTAVFLITLLVLYLYMCWNEIQVKGSLESMMLHMLIIAIGIQVCASYAYSFTRLNLNYMQFIGIVLSHILKSVNCKRLFGKWSSIASGGMSLILILIMANQYLNHVEGELLTEYQFFWQ